MHDKPDIDSLLEQGASSHVARDLDRAELLYREVLHRDPDNVEGLNFLGVILQDRGRADESLAMISRAIERDPDYSDAHANLARGLRLLDQAEKAAVAARRATELDPSLGEGWLELGIASLSLGRNQEALVALRRAAPLFPVSADLNASIASAAQRLEDYPAAVEAWRLVLKLQPDRIDALVSLGAVLGHMGDVDAAISLQRRAVELAPDDSTTLIAFAANLHRRLDAEELVSVCRILLARQPERLDVRSMLVSGLKWLGQFEEAAQICREILVARPEDGLAEQQLASLNREPVDLQVMRRFRARMDDSSIAMPDRISAGFSLARALDRKGDFDAAYDVYRSSNSLDWALANASNRTFDLKALQKFVDWTNVTFTKSLFDELRPWGSNSEVPVFIVGMPRSGTSLVEQIAASHPQVHGAGERKDIIHLVGRMRAKRDDASPALWNRELLRQEADDQIDRLLELGGDVPRVIDKLPDNIQLLGHIRLFFPNARVIVCRRDLRDVCVSCFTTHFGDSVAWATDLEDCARRAIEIERLTQIWREVLPGPVLEVQYESLVQNLEAESRRLMVFLGLDWDPACIEFHKTQRPVTTASAWQVRQPLYDTSVGRWRRYATHLGPMLKILAGHIPQQE